MRFALIYHQSAYNLAWGAKCAEPSQSKGYYFNMNDTELALFKQAAKIEVLISERDKLDELIDTEEAILRFMQCPPMPPICEDCD